jgi:hypothetical protein
MAIKKKLLIADTVSITGIVVYCRNQQIFFVVLCPSRIGEADATQLVPNPGEAGT